MKNNVISLAGRKSKQLQEELALDSIEDKEKLEELVKEIIAADPHPLDNYEIAALLESFGWNDLRASTSFGVKNVFELALLLWNIIKDRVAVESFVEDKKMGFFHIVSYTVKSFLRGMFFALPMAISVIAMLTLRFSLWSYENLSVEMATSIAIGTILSFMSVGGFMQSIARRGFFYINQGFFNMAKRITYFLIKLGYIAAIIIALIYIIFNLYYRNFPLRLFAVTTAYYFFLTANWLSVTVMYILKREFLFTGLISLGIFIVYLLFDVISLNIILSQIIALLLVSILGLILVIYIFNRAERRMEQGVSPQLPKKSILLYSLKPYFLYGLLYYTFLFVDRVLAWSTNNEFMPYIIWFRGDYELGLDFALLMLIVPMGFSEVLINRLMENLELVQKNSLIHEIEGINRKYLKLYGDSMLLITIFAVISAVAVYQLIVFFATNYSWIAHADALMNPVTKFVLFWGLASYTILCIALTNAVILFSLAQPEMVVRTFLIGLLVNFMVGFLATRWGSAIYVSIDANSFANNLAYQFAVFGLLAGTIVIAIQTTRSVIKVLNNLDYYIYVAS